jgi:cytosine deaminase
MLQPGRGLPWSGIALRYVRPVQAPPARTKLFTTQEKRKMSLVIRNARLRGKEELLDILIHGERIAEVGRNLPTGIADVLDAAGSLVVPGLFNLHFHADKCLLGEIMRPNISGTLPEAIEITNDFKRNYEPEEVARRAIRAIETGVINGTTFFRLFADVGTIGGLRAARGLLLARDRMRGFCTIQVVAFPQEGIIRDPGAAELMEEAIREGCDIVGGLPWYEYTDEEAGQHIDICFRIAQKHDLDLHMLVDDTDDANSRSLEYLALKTMREDFHGRVTASHCGAMAGYNDVYAAKVIDMVATARITISVNSHINLVCSARFDREPKRRGIARVKDLIARGVNVITAQDDVNDPYYPFGKPDPLECASMIAHVAQLTLPHELELAMDMITSNSAKAARLDPYGIGPDLIADLVVLGADSVHEALRTQSPRRHVFKAGREVARSSLRQELLK